MSGASHDGWREVRQSQISLRQPTRSTLRLVPGWTGATRQSSREARLELWAETTERWKGVAIAESDDIVVVEGNSYFPRDSVDEARIEPSGTSTHCSWKGTASYFTVLVDGQRNPDAIGRTTTHRLRPARSPTGWRSGTG